MTKQEIINYMYENHVQGDFKIEEMAEDLAQPLWTPCAERLPEDNGDYLVTRDRMGLYSYVDIVTKTNVVDKIASDIKAWMPLPEPWKAESEEA